MPRPRVDDTKPAKRHAKRRHDFLQVPNAPATSARAPELRPRRADWPPVPDLFDVITYFRARGDSFALIASIGFWIGENPGKALTARGLKLWYDAELERRAAAMGAIR